MRERSVDGVVEALRADQRGRQGRDGDARGYVRRPVSQRRGLLQRRQAHGDGGERRAAPRPPPGPRAHRVDVRAGSHETRGDVNRRDRTARVAGQRVVSGGARR